MSLDLPELDLVTRGHMVREFGAEQAGRPFVPSVLSAHGCVEWPSLMREALTAGDDVTLLDSLLRVPSLFNRQESYRRQGVVRLRSVNVRQAAERLATSEFNTWYVRGLSARLLAENVSEVEVYRAAEPKWTVASCAQHEGRTFSVQKVYDGHWAHYWPVADPNAFSIPFQPGCHHSIRRAA